MQGLVWGCREMEGWRDRGGDIRYGEVEGCRHQLWGWRDAGMRYEGVGIRHRDTDGCRDQLWGWRDAGSRYEKEGYGDKRQRDGGIHMERQRYRKMEKCRNQLWGWRDEGPLVGVEG